ncbi:hypothetical protein FGG08_000246 [Glutinoglossum americanum]|uniref:Ams2/SPT21 N-terminal domain-containing protein n=1 Tax=Glutinoglossum americanum TaxID=1670608 RepID=A0A9P8IAI0_9PEZI|nr:hypothetical protein FGG08_000246 [Glutinoglossum americanum]
MSSPHAYSRNASPRPPSASTPHSGVGGDGIPNGVSARFMRLKVLYTFDDQNKTNCLARWPHAINAQVVYLDESTPIGIIELKTCIQAIVAASPELVAQLGQDYTVYAYDYSEYETPLVGQGMLSWALASASSNPGVPAHQSRSLITGRVCTNILGIFSNGIPETLEVKLRLVPVPTFLQSEYINSMEKYRELSKVIPSGFDASAWTAYLQANPDIGQLANRLAAQPQGEGPGARVGPGPEMVSQLLSQGLLPNNAMHTSNAPTRYPLAEPPRISTAEPNSGINRTVSPTLNTSFEPSMQSMVQANLSRPASRTVSRRPSADSLSMNPPHQEVLALEEAGSNRGQEEGPPRKRAKITKANKISKSSFASQPASLRVAASTAASIRVVRPVPIHPSATGPGSIQEPPRAPTPRPTSANGTLQRSRTTARSNLANDSFESNCPTSEHIFQPSGGIRTSVETTIMSPEGYRSGSASNTPINIASSPPVMASPSPSSPGLPIMPQRESPMTKDMFDDLFGEDEDDGELEIVIQCDKQTQPSPLKELFIQECTPGPPELLPTRMPPRRSGAQKKAVSRAASLAMSDPAEPPEDMQQAPAPRQGILPKPRGDIPTLPKLQPKPPPGSVNKLPPPSRQMSRTASVGSLTLPPVSVSEPVGPPPNLRRSQSCTSGKGRQNHPMSEDSAPPKSSKAEPSKARSGSKRKQAIQSKLQAAIETGEIPPYCGNCGEIETPTWRKAWTKIFESVDAQRLVLENEGGPIVAVEDLQKDESGNVISTRLIKKSLVDGVDLGFTEILLCNPCGLWLNKFKNMRPQSQWEKDAVKKAPAKKKATAKRKKILAMDGASEANLQSEADLPTESVTLEKHPMESEQRGEDVDNTHDLPPLKRIRAQSADKSNNPSDDRQEPWDTAAAAALRRAIQSSPARFLGTRNSPIDVENLGSTRRLLFPSPKDKSQKTLLQRGAQIEAQGNIDADSRDVESEERQRLDQGDDKENCPPRGKEDDITKLVEEELDKRPATPTNDNSSPLVPFKTPNRITPKQAGIPPSPWRSFNLSPGVHNALPQPQTPNRGGPTLNAGSASTEQSPFTKHLAQLLSEAHTFEMPSPGAGQEPFGLPDFSQEDILAANLFMPSSPPPFFPLYEDPAEPSSGLWSDYNCPDSPSGDDLVKAYGLNLGGDEAGPNDVQIAASEGAVEGGVLAVDFSSFMQDIGQAKPGANQAPTTVEEQAT